MVNIFLVSHHFMFHGKPKNTYHGLLTQKLLVSYEQVLNEINEPSSSELCFLTYGQISIMKHYLSKRNPLKHTCS